MKIKFKKQWIIPAVSLFLFLFSFSLVRAATMFLAPSSGAHNSGSNFSISVRVNSAGVSINAAEGVLAFDSNELSVTSLVKSGSIFSLWVQEPDFSNALGTINFGGIIFNPGFTGASGMLLTVNFKAKTVATSQVVFSSGAVLANDGYGTNVLKAMNGASFNVGAGNIQQQPPASPKAETPVVVSGFEISSSTHPDQNKWYSNNDPVFQLKFPSDARELNLVLSRNEKSTPQIRYTPPISEKILEDVEEGVWYLHANYRGRSGLSQTIKYKFQVDSKPPRDFEVTRIDVDDPTNPQPKLLFESSDDLSGISYYEMKIGEGDWFKIAAEAGGKPYQMPPQAPGTREISVKAFDQAGNSSSSSTTTVIKSIELPIVDPVTPSKIKSGLPPVISGKATFGQKVLVFIQRSSKHLAVLPWGYQKTKSFLVGAMPDNQGVEPISSPAIISLETVADQDGRWAIEYKQPLPKGEYRIHARAIDERGAISNPSNYVVFEVISSSIFDRALELLFLGFDGLINFLSEGWFLIATAALIVSLTITIVKKIAPFIADEIRKIRYIASEYRASKKLKKLDTRTKLEFKILQKDIKKELELLGKIASHRSLHPEESYLRNKLEKYYNILKKL